ncbi:hypothetical protein BO94DRAFT_606951 [Aspergillus sclerotioniger CBS 115572]|uniref:Uncharacterized protein n=1 Tax=Aspergillus sclerotioniger CBS 115572 TaxID=1450535 RepID=A0A317VNR1_9EURO|nr:hypothetical protein BO94DRAFT_606951 [Aspergillus sclerotioniger CBS 115572]PWY74492.1 hypothetical protein BO94DRAFT_606951 [Aspergillus sclerotioniger CBS 115572]
MESHLIAREEIGNDDAAQDLYGLGVRLGFYLQGLAMILYLYGDEENYGKGLKIASGSITVSILASWFCYAVEQAFSPSEAIVVLMMVMCLAFPAKYTLCNPRTIMGETIGVLAVLLTELGTCAALLWTFGTLVHSLPRLGTPNVVFFFARVSLTGWVRYLALVYLTIDAITSLMVASRMVRVLMIAWTAYAAGRTEPSPVELDEISATIKWKSEEFFLTIQVWVVWVFTIVTVEVTLYWNHLTPVMDLRSPGQLIPFVTGLILLIDSLSVVSRAYLPRYARAWKLPGVMAQLKEKPQLEDESEVTV